MIATMTESVIVVTNALSGMISEQTKAKAERPPCNILVPRGRKLTFLSYSLLSPIGEHRTRDVTPSKGKRAKKRKRKHGQTTTNQSAIFSKGVSSDTGAPVQPEIHDHLTIGFNTTTRYLETLARNSNPSTEAEIDAVKAPETSVRPSLNPAEIKPLAAVFAPRSGQPPVLYSHLPLLTKVASLAVPSSPSIRIISLPEGAEDRLKTVLGIPRVGIVGLVDGAPNASSLIKFIRQRVSEFEVPWLQEAVKATYLPVKINAN